MRDNRQQDHDLLREVAQEAAQLALRYWGRPVQKKQKADGTVVTEADLAVDVLLANRLRKARPDYGWLSEESPDHANRLDARKVWIVDPIDGTRAFLQGRSDWTIAIALVENGAPALAAVVNPVRGEAFDARAGAGAFLNGWRIHASERSTLEGVRLVVPEPLLDNTRWATPWPQPAPLSVHSTLYRLALVAAGKADASFALKPKWEWDVVAGALLVSEAGGFATDPSGGALRFNSAEAKVRGFLACGPKLHQILLERMTEAL